MHALRMSLRYTATCVCRSVCHTRVRTVAVWIMLIFGMENALRLLYIRGFVILKNKGIFRSPYSKLQTARVLRVSRPTRHAIFAN